MAQRSRKKTGGDGAVQGRSNREWVWGLILIVSVVLAYSPVWWAGYIWDDDRYVTANPVLVGPLGLKEIWTTRAADSCPVTMTTLWLEHALWGLRPLPYHLVNVFLQAACGLVLWRVLLRLRVPGAWLGAMLWTLHPVQVESVAWISEMKNTESGLFFLLAVFFFLRGLKPESFDLKTRWNYQLTLIFAVLAMGSKSSTVFLPIVLCLCAWWAEGKWSWRILMRTVPTFILSAITSAMTIWTFRQLGNTDSVAARSWPERLVDAGEAVWFYLGKLVWPHPLTTLYPRWDIEAGEWTSWVPLVAAIFLLVFLWFQRQSLLRPCFFAYAYFLTALLPILGLVSQSFMRYAVVADHHQYLASIGPLVLAGAGLTWAVDFILPGRCRLRTGLCAGLLWILGGMSWLQAWKYENEKALWSDTLARNPNSVAALTNLGNALLHDGRVADAESCYFKALEIEPNSAQTYSNLGVAFFQQGNVDEAIIEYQKALSIDPSRARTEADLAFALNQKGQAAEAVAHYFKSVKMDPSYAEAHFNLGTILLKYGRADLAVIQYQAAIAVRPVYIEAHYNLGGIFLQQGKVDEAMAQYQAALAVRPDYAEAHNNLGAAYMQKHQPVEAMHEFQTAVDLKPDFTDAQKNLTIARAQVLQ